MNLSELQVGCFFRILEDEQRKAYVKASEENRKPDHVTVVPVDSADRWSTPLPKATKVIEIRRTISYEDII